MITPNGGKLMSNARKEHQVLILQQKSSLAYCGVMMGLVLNG